MGSCRQRRLATLPLPLISWLLPPTQVDWITEVGALTCGQSQSSRAETEQQGARLRCLSCDSADATCRVAKCQLGLHSFSPARLCLHCCATVCRYPGASKLKWGYSCQTVVLHELQMAWVWTGRQ